MHKKGDVWISAVLYFGIGIVVLTILLTAGLPVINKLRDKNIIVQTKEVMHTLDENIREVMKDGPGSQRLVTVNLKKGSLNIEGNKVKWVYDRSKVPISEVNPDNEGDIVASEGNLKVKTIQGTEKGVYIIEIFADYSDLAIVEREAGSSTTLVGLSDLLVKNDGVPANQPAGQEKVKIVIRETNK